MAGNRYRNSGGGRSSYPGNGYYRRKRKRDRERRIRMAVGAAAGILVVALAVFGVRKFMRAGESGAGTAAAGASEVQAETITVESTELKKAVTINDVDITGMSREEAKNAVLSKFSWGMKAELENAGEGDEPYEIMNLLSLKLDKILAEIYDSGKTPAETYSIDAESLDAEISAEAAAMAEKWNRKPKNGAVESYDKENKQFKYTESVDGRTVNQEKLAEDIRTAMKEKNYDRVIKVQAENTPAELSAAEAKEKYKIIGTFTTKATANADRNNNLNLACQAINGKILQVGEEFSFNKTTGNRTLERGYKPAGAYQNGVVVQEPGGGVCQVSSTLYNAVIKAGLTPTERHAHTFEPSYVTPGEDATVSYDGYAGPDMRFVNTTSSSIAIRADFYDRTVTVSIVGLPVLEDGVTISLSSKKTEEFDNASIEYVEDTTLQPNVENIIDNGSMGSRWVTNLVTKKDGEVVSDVFFHNSTYKGHSKKIARNTSGVVTIPEGETTMIVENTETVAEQRNDSATEAETVHVVQVGPGESMAVTQAPQHPSSETVSQHPAASQTQAETRHAEPQETAPAAPGPGSASPQTENVSSGPGAVSSTVEAAPGPGSADTAAAGPQSETVAPFPGP